MRVGAIVQARMSSARLPGKTLTPLAGRPALDWVLDRLEHASEPDALLVATSDAETDDEIAEHCGKRNVACHRGELEDVAARLVGAARSGALDAFARVNGDSPLIDQRLVDHGIALMRQGDADLVTNVRPRTFPPGQSVEVVRTEALAEALAAGADEETREHVTGPLYEGRFRVLRFEAAEPRTDVRFTLDMPEDQTRLAAILEAMDRPHWEYTWEEVIALA